VFLLRAIIKANRVTGDIELLSKMYFEVSINVVVSVRLKTDIHSAGHSQNALVPASHRPIRHQIHEPGAIKTLGHFPAQLAYPTKESAS
jgi:hypothetical protein